MPTASRRKQSGINQSPGPRAHGFGDLAAHESGGFRLDQRPERRLVSQGIAEHVALGQFGAALDEVLVDAPVDIDPLDAAAGLAGVEEGAVDQSLDSVREIRVGADIARVLASELEADAEKAARGGGLDRATALDGAGEIDLINARLARIAVVCACVSTRFWNSPSGRPAKSKARWKRSPTNNVCAACLRITALPAISAGTIELTAVR